MYAHLEGFVSIFNLMSASSAVICGIYVCIYASMRLNTYAKVTHASLVNVCVYSCVMSRDKSGSARARKRVLVYM